MKRLLVITTLYPNAVQFRHGIFVETRLRRLIEHGGFEAVVIAPVPWFPFTLQNSLTPNYAEIPKEEVRHGIRVCHPRYLVMPKLGMVVTPFFMALAVILTLARIRKSGHGYDIIDTHYFYPDGVAAALISGLLAVPFVVTARGSDINLMPDYSIPRRLILWAARKAGASIAVSKALQQRLVNLGVDSRNTHVLRNGVDLEFFAPRDRRACKAKMGVGKFTLVSVGNLLSLKGHDLVINAMLELRECDLMVVGDGELEAQLKGLIASLGLEQRVRLSGAVPQEELVQIYNAADVLVLASSHEGLPNVALEAMACGTPVVATRVGGIPEIVTNPAAGLLLERRDVASIVRSVRQLQADYPEHDATRRQAARFSWDETIANLAKLFNSLT